ncbi:MAG: hypothetical protein HY975_03240 [Candidatus Kerfeldbacteria bacterium]|nr:hypothetical protein [Candidatus Kerfeldbacteria bacterium]
MHTQQRSGLVLSPAVIAVALAVLVVGGLAVGYFGSNWWSNQTATNTTTLNTVANTAVNSNTSTANTNTVSNTNTPGTPLGDITWQAPKKVANLKLFVDAKSEEACLNNAGSTYYQVGTVNTGTYAGATIYLMSVAPDCPQTTTYIRLLKTGTNYVVLAKNSDSWASSTTYYATNVTVDTTYELPGLRFPATLTGPKPRQVLSLVANVNGLFESTGLTKVFTDATYGPVYTKAVEFSGSKDVGLGTSEIVSRDGFYLKAPDGTLIVYQLKLDVTDPTKNDPPGELLKATWTDGTVNTTNYVPTALTGCGAGNYLNVITTVNRTTDLVKSGMTNTGDALYIMKDSNATRLKDYYTTTYQVFDGVKVSYETFIAMHPLVFWVDPFDRLVIFTNAKFLPAVECGKPVIYLYPTTTTTVDVHLAPVGGFTKSEPAYGDGWRVVASPDGQLVNTVDGRRYPYLFWEGRGGLYTAPTKGFTVAQRDVHTFLVTTLGKLGLNPTETADFIAFWEPRMQGSPYYVVSFYGRAMMDALAPLTVTPTPDTVIRILMDYRPVAGPVAVQSYPIVTPVRRGFTVVEWGGVLR